MAVTRAGVTPANIWKARVLDVNIGTYTLSVASEFAKKPLTGISFATPYQHFVNGEGIYFMPEVGSICWVCEPSDGGMPFVLAWASGQDEGDFRARKQDLNPGDIYMGTRDENFLVLRRGGVVQIGGTGLCQRMFLPINNTIRDFCENYNLFTLAGDLEWGIARQETDTDGKLPGLLKIKAREFARDQNPIAELTVGSHKSDSDNNTILQLVIKSDGSTGASQQIKLTCDKQGNIHWTVQNDVTYDVNGNWSINVKGNITEKASGNIDLEANGTATLKAEGVTTVEGDGGVTIKAPLTTVTGQMTVGGAGALPVALAPPLIAWLATHFHQFLVAATAAPAPGNSVTLVTLPPAAPPPPNIASAATTSL